jgi:hypothetical protein
MNRRRAESHTAATLMRLSIAAAALVFAGFSVWAWPPFGHFGADWGRFGATLASGFFFALFFGAWSLKTRSLLAAFIGLTVSLLLAGTTAPLLYTLSRISRAVAIAYAIGVVFLWLLLLLGWRRIYRALYVRLGVS